MGAVIVRGEADVVDECHALTRDGRAIALLLLRVSLGGYRVTITPAPSKTPLATTHKFDLSSASDFWNLDVAQDYLEAVRKEVGVTTKDRDLQMVIDAIPVPQTSPDNPTRRNIMGAKVKKAEGEKKTRRAKRDANGVVGRVGRGDDRLPKTGTELSHTKRGGDTVTARVVEGGVEYNKTLYASISGAARQAMRDLGHKWPSVDGFAFWGLKKPPKRPKKDTTASKSKSKSRSEGAAV
jgi:hypothetical protein